MSKRVDFPVKAKLDWDSLAPLSASAFFRHFMKILVLVKLIYPIRRCIPPPSGGKSIYYEHVIKDLPMALGLTQQLICQDQSPQAEHFIGSSDSCAA